MAEYQDTTQDTNTCVVCFKNVEYYSIGECDHPVCFECSTRMRVLCLQNECPICRQDLSRVVFTETIQLYKQLRNKVFTDRLFERQFKIGFCSEEIQKAYEHLLENRCKYCDKLPPFRTFSMLSDHMRKAHERYFCDLCVKHLKIFTFERKCYTRQELAHHRRKGDLDDTSHRGHPLCEFCEERFMDADELYRHLRKEHLYCHLCDADGRNLYYASHAALAQHFRTDHYLCEEGDCADNHLTAVFRTEIDLKAHKATVHGRGMTRGAARQARTLELQFNITPHPVVTSRGGPRDRDREPQEAPSPPPSVPQSPRIDTRSDAQFPRLSAAPTQPHLLLGASAGARAYKGTDGLARNERNFPTLGGAGAGGPSRAPPAPRPAAPASAASAILRNSKPSVSIQLHSQPTSASNFRLTQAGGNRISIPQQQRKPPSDDDFPSLGKRDRDFDDHPNIGAGTVQPPKVALINSQDMQSLKSNQTNSQPKKAAPNSEAFPALGGGASKPAAPPQWITVRAKDKKQLRPEPTPPPAPRPASFNPVADFPTLPVNAKPQKNKKTPVLQQFTPPPAPKPQPQPEATAKSSKKEKKKQNAIFFDELDGVTDQSYSYVNGITDKFSHQHIRDAYVAAMNDNNNQPPPEAGKKIKTIVDTSAVANTDKKTNRGNGDFALASAEFPSLNPNGDVAPAAPPRYPAKKKTPNGNLAPGSKTRPPCDGMTFTNSSGQTFPAPLHKYIPPPDFEQRNRTLVKKFAVALGGAAAVEDFKVASRAFRDNIITAEEFYDHLQHALGPQLDSVFPELVALLPDIAKQQELAVGRQLAGRLEVCAACGQLTAPADRLAHDTEHWPALS